MSYTTVIISGKTVETYVYEKRPATKKRSTLAQDSNGVPRVSKSGSVAIAKGESAKVRSKTSVRRAVLAFRRLVGANLYGSAHPVLASFTYAKLEGDIRRGRKDFNAFAKRLYHVYGEAIRYIAVAEYQKRGAVHFHALVWGFAEGVVERERSTRMVASLWGKGFVDLVPTDGNERLAGYLAKYMGKAFTDPRLYGRKAYIASRNVLRPTTDKDTLLAPYFHGKHGVDLSTYTKIDEKSYDTMWLGRAIYKRYEQ